MKGDLKMNSLWHGFKKIEFEFEGHEAILVFPNTEPNGNWTLKTEYWDAFPSTKIENRIPIIMLYGTEDCTVDYNKNGRIFADAYKGNEDLLLVIPREMQGHHPHGFFDNPQKLADLIMERI